MLDRFELYPNEEVFEIIERDSIYGFATRLVVTVVDRSYMGVDPFSGDRLGRDEMRFWIGWKEDLTDKDVVSGCMVKVASVLVTDDVEDRERCSQAFWDRWTDMIHLIEYDWGELEEESNHMAEDRVKPGDSGG
jgi:hypothetical protein